MDALNLDMNKIYTYADYLTWTDDVRRELIQGSIFEFPGGNPTKHQRVLGCFIMEFSDYCKKFNIDFYNYLDVRFPEDKSITSDNLIYTVVQPDFIIVKDKEKLLDDRGCLGRPDFIIEVIAKETCKRDIQVKFKLYENYGVSEYWIVSPNDENVSVFLLDENCKYKLVGMYAEDDKIPVNIFNGDLKIDLTEIFE